MKKLLFLMLAVLLVASCSTPLNKEQYLKKFDAFVSEVAQNTDTYSEKQWKKTSIQYEKYTGSWYEKFKGQLTFKETVKFRANQVRYNYYTTVKQPISAVKDFLNSFDIEDMKNQILYYMENDMRSDIQMLYNEAINASAETKKAIEEIFEELNLTLEDLKN